MADQQKLYDTTTIELIGRNNPSFLNEMIVMFVKLVSKDFEALKAAALDNRWDEAGQLAHKIKSALGNMGVTNVMPYIKALETRTGDGMENFKHLEEGLLKVLAQMQQDHAQLFK